MSRDPNGGAIDERIRARLTGLSSGRLLTPTARRRLISGVVTTADDEARPLRLRLSHDRRPIDVPVDMQGRFAVTVELPVGLTVASLEMELGGDWRIVEHGRLLRLPGVELGFTASWPGLRHHLDQPSGRTPIHACGNDLRVAGWIADLPRATIPPVRLRRGGQIIDARPVARDDVREAFAAEADLPLHVGFEAEVRPPLGLSTWRVEAFRDGAWMRVHTLRLANLGALQGPSDALSVDAYIAHRTAVAAAQRAEFARHIAVVAFRPTFSILLSGDAPEARERTLEALAAQVYTRFTVTEAESDWALATQTVEGDFLVHLLGGDRPAPDMLYRFAAAVNAHPDLAIIYGDDVRTTAAGQSPSLFVKPAWSPELLGSFHYLGRCCAIRRSLVQGRNATSWHDLVLFAASAAAPVMRVPETLLTAADSAAEAREHAPSRRLKLRDDAEIPDLTRVSVVIPTAGHVGDLNGRPTDLVVNLVTRLRAHRDGAKLEIIVVDNGDLGAKRERVLAAAGCLRITDPSEAFNLARKINFGAAAARGEQLLLLNDDIEPQTEDWIDVLLRRASTPGVGAVGAKLLYPDGRVQHAGVVMTAGSPEHVSRLSPGEDPGYFFSAITPRRYLAVTGAVMMTSAAAFRAVGGWSEDFPVNFNDIDYCLKLRGLGLASVFEPNAILTHFESASRPPRSDVSELSRFQKRWASVLADDPYYDTRYLNARPANYTLRVGAGR